MSEVCVYVRTSMHVCVYAADMCLLHACMPVCVFVRACVHACVRALLKIELFLQRVQVTLGCGVLPVLRRVTFLST